jgi:histidinol-phosphatase (PHP family)
MRWTNYHCHCTYCDGRGTIEEFILRAIEFDMSVLGISSHAPVPFPTKWNIEIDDVESYVSEIKYLKEKYKKDIEVLTALEVDYLPGITSPGDAFIKNIGLDYIIGSVHFMGVLNDGTHWTMDGALDDFMYGLQEIYDNDIKKLVSEYYKRERDMVKSSLPDIIAHMDKVKMQGINGGLFDESESWYRDELRHTLEVIKEHGTIVEINTKLFPGRGYFVPGKEYFKWLKELDIPIVINSDAHDPRKLTVGFKEVVEILKAAGIEYKQEFVKGEWKGGRM